MMTRIRSLFRGGVVLAALFVTAGAQASGPEKPAPATAPSHRPSLVLITVEGLRPDWLGCYKGSMTTPSIDRLAADSRLFERVLAPSPSSLPSLATVMTGTYPFRHGVWEDDYRNRLGSQVPSLAVRLRESGYRTGAFVATSRLAASRGFNRGFGTYEDGYPPNPTGAWKLVRRPGSSLVPAVKTWLDGVGKSSFFLWVHFVEAGVLGPASVEDPARDARTAYPRRVEELDIRVGELLQALRDRGVYDETVIALTADHGLGLGDHDELRSGVFVYETTLRVPLLVKGTPADPGKGSRVGDLAGLIDLYPTLERLVGLPRTPGLPGRDLFSASPAAAYYAVALMGREVFGWAPFQLVAEGNLRLVTGRGSQLYDLATDPQQERNLSGSHAAQAARLETIRRKLTGGAALPPSHYLPAALVPDPLARKLAALGFASPNGKVAAARQPDDPAKHRRSLALLEAIHLEVEAAGFAAIARAENTLLETDPALPFTLLNTSQLNLDRGARDPHALERAAAQLRTLQRLYPKDPEVYHLLGHLAFSGGTPGNPEDFLRVSRILGPRYPGEVAYDLACAYARRGKSQEAVSELRRGIGLGYRDADHISADPDLESLRENPAFKQLMQKEFPSISGS
jgi:arylsulfatase A-like enzyme